MRKNPDAPRGFLQGINSQRNRLLFLLMLLGGGAAACSHGDNSLSGPMQVLAQPPREAKNEGHITDTTLLEKFYGKDDKLERESKEGVVFDGKRYFPHFDINKLPPSPIKGLPPVFQKGDYFVLGDCGPEAEGLHIKIFEGQNGFEMKIEDAKFKTPVRFAIDPDTRQISVGGKEIPLTGVITLENGVVIEIVSYVYPHVAIVVRNNGTLWGQFFKEMPPKAKEVVKK
ncbi:MAG: hypothetical protein V2A63_00390 [Patescibacteria group bacterium]